MENQKQLLKGSTQTLILAILRDQPRHGYAIAREIERRSDHGVTFHDSTLYPALKKLENDGLIVGAWEAWETTDNAPPRKTYRLTEAGAVELERRLTDWSQFVRAINAILGIGPDAKTRTRHYANDLTVDLGKSAPIMFLQQKTNDSTHSAPLQPVRAEHTGAASEQEVERRLVQASVEDYLDRVCVPFVETLPYAARVEMRREIASHLKALGDAYAELGDPPATATQKALVKFGSPEQVARLWRESSAMSSGREATKRERFAGRMRRHWPGVSVTLSALFLLAGWLSPLHPVATERQNMGTTASIGVGKSGSNLSAAGLTISGFHHMEAVKDKNCADCHRMTGDQTFLAARTRQWMDSRAQKSQPANVK